MKIANIKIILILAVSFLFIQNAGCQRGVDSSNLIKFIQQNADSSIIYYSTVTLFIGKPAIMIASKIGDGYIFSTYSDIYKQFSLQYKLPKGEIAKKFRQESQTFNQTLPDTNKYFIPKIIPFPKQELLWKKLISLDIWNLKDDTDTISNKIGRCYVYDGWGANIILLTNNSFKHLFFNNPDFYEECLPGSINRQKALKIVEIFSDTFGDGEN